MLSFQAMQRFCVAGTHAKKEAMKQIALVLLFAVVISSCSKQSSEKENVLTCLNPPAWLEDLKATSNKCTCMVVFLSGTWNGRPVIESRIIDPLCNGIPVLYDYATGSQLIWGDQQLYNKYISQVKNLTEIWRCSK